MGHFGTFWAMLAPYWAHVGPFCAIFGSVSAFVLDLGISVSLNFRPCNAFAKKTINTSSTAQGGGGRFKNRKPIGEDGCCESGMAERSH